MSWLTITTFQNFSILRYLKSQEFIWKILTTSNYVPNLMFLWQPYLKVIFFNAILFLVLCSKNVVFHEGMPTLLGFIGTWLILICFELFLVVF